MLVTQVGSVCENSLNFSFMIQTEFCIYIVSQKFKSINHNLKYSNDNKKIAIKSYFSAFHDTLHMTFSG